MLVQDNRTLERELLDFIKRFSGRPSPESEFNALALRVFRHQFENNTFYRRFCAIVNRSPANVLSWTQIPAMPASAFKELVLTSFPAKEKVRVFRTTGTSAGALVADGTTASGRGAHFFRTLRLYEASIVPAFEANLLPDRPTLSYYFLINPPKDAPDSSLSYMMGVVNRRFAGNKGRFYVRKGAPRFDELLRDLKKERKKVFLLATAFALKGFLEHLKRKKARSRLADGSRLMETGGFKGRTKEISKEALYRECGQRLGVPTLFCFSEYGMTELSSQYYSRGLGALRGPAWIRTVVVDPRTGKESSDAGTGILKHVDLANLGSVMAVQSEDLGKKEGQGFKLLGRAPGSGLRGCSLDYETLVRSSS